MADIEDILIEMEEELSQGKKALFGTGITVDGELMYGLIDRLRQALPNIIREARIIIDNEERRKSEDTLRAQNIILTAQQRAEEILSEHHIISQAEKEADAIRNQVQDYKNRILTEIKKDIDTLLSDTENMLTDSINIIKSAKRNNNQQ